MRGVGKSRCAMTLMIELPAELENRLKIEAQTRGVAPEEYARKLLEENLPKSSPPEEAQGNSLQRLFAQWDAEDATDDPAEIARRQQEWEELKKALNENRGSYRKPFP